MWLTGGMGRALGRENEVSHTIRGRRKRSGEGKEREKRNLLKLPQLTFQFLISPNHSFLDRINWKRFKGNI